MPTELSLLLPSHSLEDFPTHLAGRQADELLAAWSGLWHPALLAAANKIPTFLFSGDSLTRSEQPLIVIPSAARDQLSDDEVSLAREQGTLLVEAEGQTRDDFVAAGLQAAQIELPTGQAGETYSVADFFALGFAYLQTELLTRRMRYSSHLDEGQFERATIAAAEGWKANDSTQVAEQLATAFNCLMEARSQFYPVDAFLIDVLLIAPTTIGHALRNELASKVPKSVMISAATLQQMAEQEPESLALLRQAIATEHVGLIGADIADFELPLMPHEEILAELQAAEKIYTQLLGRRPTVFGRRQFGLTPVLPQILNQAGFVGAWHVALDDGLFPQSDRRKSRWEGMDDSTIDTLAAVPLDASRPESYLQLAEELGNTMDHDFVATLMFARWPSQGSPFHGDLQRTASFAPLLGKFVTIDAYFRDTEQPGNHTKFSPDQYRPAYLQQAVERNAADAISTHIRNAKKWAQSRTAAAMATMAASIDSKPIENLEGTLNALPLASAAKIAAALPPTQGKSGSSDSVLVVNPLSFERQIGIELRGADGRTRAFSANVPAMGFAWIDPVSQKAAVEKKRRSLAIAEGNVLRNRHCEVTIHPATGGIQSIYDLRSHGNRLSQQLAVRLPGDVRTASVDSDGALYTEMKADSIDVLHSDAVLGRIAIRGSLLDLAGKVVARFKQTFSLWQTSRVIELEIGLTDFTAELASNPWASYLATRFAWSDPAADLIRSVHGCKFATDAKRIIATDFLEIATGSLRTSIFPIGLPYHQRSGPRMLDTLLRVRGETESTFRLGIGLDVPHSWRYAQELLNEPTAGAMPREPLAKQGWLFHFDAPNVAATSWSPLVEAGRVVGFRVRLVETEGHGGRVAIRSFKPAVSAMHTNVNGEPLSGLPIDGDAVLLDIGAYQWTQVEARW